MNINKNITPVKGYLYIKIILAICIGILLLYFCINTFILGRSALGLSCLFCALLISIDLIYIVTNRKLLFDLFISILSFAILCILIPILKEDIHLLGNMWIFLIPGITFYTQTIKRSVIILGTLFFGFIVPNFILSFQLTYIDLILSLEKMLVFTLISYMTYLYAKASEHKNVVLRNYYLHNQLTGLPNRKKLLKDLDSNEYRILALVNIDGFTNINNLYGAKIGDEVILKISQRLKEFVLHKQGYHLYKLHADEYAVCIFNSNDINEEIKTLSKLTYGITNMITIENHDIYPSITIGVSQGYNDIIEDADMALKNAKEKRKNISIYDKNIGMEDKFRKDLLCIYKLRKAIKNDGIRVFLQPIVNISTGLVEKYESLVRIVNENEVISPLTFLNISKQIKVYHKITKIVIDKAFLHFSKYSGSFSINLDADDLMNDDTTNYIYKKILEYGNGSRIIFEILESQAMDNPIKVMQFIDNVKLLGCQIAIDDFGSGYSNFDYLLKFKIDFLKIDAALIKNIDTDPNSYIMTKSIATFAKQLGIKTIAEHIDKESILEIIKDLGIDYGQGYLWSPPLPKTNNKLKCAIL